MLFRPATAQELDGVMTIIEDGRAALARLGIDQWQGGSPNREMVLEDFAAKRTMVAVDDDGNLLGTLAFMDTVEPDYSNIIWGSWMLDNLTAPEESPSNAADAHMDSGPSLGESPDAHSDGCTYATLHRVAVARDAARKGVGTFMILRSIELATSLGLRSVRVDTHEGNIPMQRLLKRCGLHHCCDVEISLPLEQTRKRLGYEVILP